ncbi:MAG: glycosidase, partial [Dethiobacter sp.]|nr:glycosidase [Dethiobacter sp.]
GLRVDERLPKPVFMPAHPSEKMGCEDPRLVAIDERVYMLYTAYDGVIPQIALASIDKDDLIHRRWQQWRRHGLVFPGFTNKDAVLFPERFNGKLAMYHRIAPSIWVAFSDSFDTPWPREGHKIIMGSRSGMMWDAVKIGAGAQPLKTRFGWMHIYHGVDYSFRYCLGVFLTALDDPARLIYRSPNSILEPEKSYETGQSGQSWVPNVVFTCGAVPVTEKAVLDEDDEILVYYGGADTVIGVATARISDLIPLRYRRRD